MPDADLPKAIDRCYITGMSGCGKTSLVEGLIDYREVQRSAIYDPEDEYERESRILCQSREEVADYFKDIVDRGHRDEPFTWHMRYVPPMPQTDNADLIAQAEASEAGYLAHWCQFVENCLLVIDEAHNACGQNLVSGHTVMVAKRGRKRDVFLWTSSQGIKDVSKIVRKELKAVESWYGRQIDEGDLAELRSVRKDLAERVASLPLLHMLRVDPVDAEIQEWGIIFRGSDAPPTLVRL